MSLKKLVNDVETYGAFLEHLDSLIAREQKNIETLTDTTLIFRTQGALLTLKKLKSLRETINGKHS